MYSMLRRKKSTWWSYHVLRLGRLEVEKFKDLTNGFSKLRKVGDVVVLPRPGNEKFEEEGNPKLRRKKVRGGPTTYLGVCLNLCGSVTFFSVSSVSLRSG